MHCSTTSALAIVAACRRASRITFVVNIETRIQLAKRHHFPASADAVFGITSVDGGLAAPASGNVNAGGDSLARVIGAPVQKTIS